MARSVTARPLKFDAAEQHADGGMKTSPTNEVTILPNAPPITTPTAMIDDVAAHRERLEFVEQGHGASWVSGRA